MACYITPAIAAAIATSFKKKVPEKYHLEWLTAMLWGGSAMLLVEHMINGEIDASHIVWEMATEGLAVTAAAILLWMAAIFFLNRAEWIKLL